MKHKSFSSGKTKNPKYLKGLSTTDDSHYIDFIKDAFDENNILNYFLSRIDSFLMNSNSIIRKVIHIKNQE